MADHGGADRYKTRLCRHYADGFCHRGENCTFAHGEYEISYDEGAGKGDASVSWSKGVKGGTSFKTKLCSNHMQEGYCRRGESCSFAHGEMDMRADSGFKGGKGWEGDGKAWGGGGKGSGGESRYKTRLCNNFQSGWCVRGEECAFAHGEYELRDPGYEVGKGYGGGKSKGYDHGKGYGTGKGYDKGYDTGKGNGGGKGFKGGNDFDGGYEGDKGRGKRAYREEEEWHGSGNRGGKGAYDSNADYDDFRYDDAYEGYGRGGKGKGKDWDDGEVPFKMKLCRHFGQGWCERGNACTFAHGDRELRREGGGPPGFKGGGIKGVVGSWKGGGDSWKGGGGVGFTDASKFKTKMCSNFDAGWCERGDACVFAHGNRDLREQEFGKAGWKGGKKGKRGGKFDGYD